MASSDLLVKQHECESLQSQVELLTSKLATQEERLRKEKTKVQEVIQAQRDVRKSISASSSKREPELSSPGKPGPSYGQPSSAQKSRRTGGQPQVDENLALSLAESLNENEQLRTSKLELENSN